ncbi:uncharacterized protein LOC142344941 [Convolutriloba macropyga]|uniref:uncharacterized protein LOC142344941 n=1 Tax=Convolutriloba macropyga TaxID=536237 RepID=UPI003F52412C
MGKVKSPKKASKSSDSINRVKTNSNMRDKSTINRLKMYRGGKAKRDKNGKIVKAAIFQQRVAPGTQARVAPDRRWFNNTRVIGQNALQDFQSKLETVSKDPYQVILNPSKLPITLLNERGKYKRMHILETQSFEYTFGKKAQRKLPNFSAVSLADYASTCESKGDEYKIEGDRDVVREDDGVRDEARHWSFGAGASKRIWNELYKVIDSSDILLYVLDARNPMGTRSSVVEKYLQKEKRHKHLVFIINKVDLVPTWVTKAWVALLSREYPTMAMHASMKNPFGKGALIQLLRQFSVLHKDLKQISVGIIGYPNVGKSSVINTLRKKKVCKVAPIAGETKVWQYITLMKRIYLIDCPGVVYNSQESDTELLLKGAVRVENVPQPEQHIDQVLQCVNKYALSKIYDLGDWTDSNDFLERLAFRTGKLFKKAEPDVTTVAKMVLNDFQRGRLPYFVNPKPYFPEEEQKMFEEKLLSGKSGDKNDDLVEQNLDEIACVHTYEEKAIESAAESKELSNTDDKSKKEDISYEETVAEKNENTVTEAKKVDDLALEENIDAEAEDSQEMSQIVPERLSDGEGEDLEFLDDVRQPVESRKQAPISEASGSKKGRKNTQKQRKLERKRVLAMEGNTEDDLKAPKKPQNYYDKVNVKNKSNWTKA